MLQQLLDRYQLLELGLEHGKQSESISGIFIEPLEFEECAVYSLLLQLELQKHQFPELLPCLQNRKGVI